MVPDYLQDLRPEKSTPGRYMFGNKDEFVPPEWRLRTYQKSFLPFAVSLWNSLEEDTRTISNYELFKETLMGNVNDNPLFHLGTRQEQIVRGGPLDIQGGARFFPPCANILFLPASNGKLFFSKDTCSQTFFFWRHIKSNILFFITIHML